MKDIAIVYVLFGDRAAAEDAATQMIDRRLAACANVQADCLSVYRWQGVKERSDETPVLFKTALDRRSALMAALAVDHDYELPAISSWTATTTDAYADWVEVSTGQ
ncbi:MAG: divalent-cation tolerance protein CutA [Sphingobium sp.]|nr:divalent-cation tolerance protein CutA [Sphingobium sp.]